MQSFSSTLKNLTELSFKYPSLLSWFWKILAVDLEITHLIHASSLLLSRHYIMTAGINFKNLWRSVRYQQQIVQPIFVVILPNFEAYLEFAEVTKTYPMSFPVWFTMFFYIPDNSTPDYCHEPIGNPFNLKFDTQMLVLCRNDSILREWHSVKGETVKIFNLAEWENTDEGFILLTNLSLYDRRKDMEGHVLRVVTLKVFDKVWLSYTYGILYMAYYINNTVSQKDYYINFLQFFYNFFRKFEDI